VIQDYSLVAMQAFFLEDHRDNNFLVSYFGKEEKKIFEEIEKSLKVSLKEEMESLVDSYFQILKLAKSNLS
jgi:hypothetical protein